MSTKLVKADKISADKLAKYIEEVEDKTPGGVTKYKLAGHIIELGIEAHKNGKTTTSTTKKYDKSHDRRTKKTTGTSKQK